MTLIDGDRIVTAQLYDDEYEEFTEQKISIIDYVNAYTTEGVTTADDVLNKIRAEIEFERDRKIGGEIFEAVQYKSFDKCLEIIDKYIVG